ncbi:hypothetical protein [Mesorhizobium amorphae]|uniref:hypothetical protein n=1 Tax=Mesorhizobium amorphae TaxID=71433 RepID=UPI00177E046E|nr:hypothetical protein [Mesorhizobium amorphae]
MPNTPVRAAAEGMSNNPRNPHRLAFFRKMQMPWHVCAESEPATPNEAQESFMNQHVNRRALLAATTVAAAGIAAATPKAHARFDDTAEVKALIKAHRVAEIAFDKALIVDGDMEQAYFNAHPEKELLVPLSIGGAQSFYIRFDLDHYAADCAKEISARYEAKRRGLHELRAISPDLADQAVEVFNRGEETDIATLVTMLKAEKSKRNAFGWGKAHRAYDATSNAVRRALDTLVAHRCTSPAANRARAKYLLKATGGRFAELEPYQVKALLNSLRAVD